MKGLQDILGLPAGGRAAATGQSESFRRTFQQGMSGVNQELKVVAAQASQDAHQQLENQRSRLFEAYQRAMKQVDTVDESQVEKTIERVMAAVSAVGEKAASAAADALDARDRWSLREEDFEDAVVRIGELEEGKHPKSAALRKLAEEIRKRVNDRKYGESIDACEKRFPKLDDIYEHFREDTAEEDGDASISDEESEAMWKEIEELERRLEQIMKEQQIKS